MGRFIPNGDLQRKRMLETIGVENFDELLKPLPKKYHLKKLLDIP